jgi:hypothetical protein
MKRPYNPAFHHNIPDNYRRTFKERHRVDCLLTDEQIYNISEDCAFTENPDQDTLESMLEEHNAIATADTFIKPSQASD